MIKRFAVFILFLFSLLPMLFALTGEMIYFSTTDELKAMAMARGLEAEGSDEEIRDRLYFYEGLEKVEVKVEEGESEDKEEKKDEDSSYVLTVLGADSLKQSDSALTLEGNVKLSFRKGDGNEKILSAAVVIVDTEFSKITALGDASYVDDSKDAPIQEISADIFTLLWDQGDLYISGGSTKTERKNSEEKSVVFHTSGEMLSYLSEGAMVYDEGYITSNPSHAYSSISANRIAILPGEDMFLSSATFRIGRVPVFWIPFFFFPGSRIVANPSFGFSSSKGAFLNTTLELFGSYPKIEDSDESSSFSSILKSTSDQSGFLPVGFYYGEKDDLSPIEKWAKSSGSYGVIMADSYTGSGGAVLPTGGVHLGLEGKINLLDGKLKLSLLDALAYSSPVTEKGDKFRFYGENTLDLSLWGMTIEAKYPFYSDQYVLRDFTNRITGFSISPILGEESTFPDKASTVSSFSRYAKASWRLPSSYSSLFLSSASVNNLTLKESYTLDQSKGEFILKEMVLPSFSVSLSGALLDLKEKEKTAIGENKDESAAKEESEEKDPLLGDKYSFSSEKTTSPFSSTSSSAMKLSWSLNGDMHRDTQFDNKGEEKGQGRNASVSGKVNFNGTFGPVFTISDVLTPSYAEKTTLTPSSYYTSSTTRTTYSLNNTFSLSVPSLGLGYTLSLRLHSYTEDVSEKIWANGDSNREEKKEDVEFSWDKSNVKTHEISFSKSLDTAVGKFTGKINYVLPPLTSTISPYLSWGKGGFTLSLSSVFREDEDENFRIDTLSSKFSFSGKNTSFSTEAKYTFEKDWSDYDPSSMKILSSLSLFTSDKKFSLEEKVEYTPLSANGNKNWFSSITTSIKADFLSSTIVYSSRDDERIELDRIRISTSSQAVTMQSWKGRLFLSFSMASSLDYQSESRNRSSLSVSPALKLSVAEFMDFSLSFTSENRNIGSYFKGDDFSFSAMFEDLKRSFDFTGDGRKNTFFILKSISLEAVHVMEDWDLNCKYNTEIVKSQVAGRNIYTLQPSLSVFLSWKTMPDLKVEENWKQKTQGDGTLIWEKY